MGDRLQRAYHLGVLTSHLGRLNLLPSTGREMSTNQMMLKLCGWGVKAGVAHFICGCKCRWQVKLGDPSLTRAIPEYFRDEYHTQYKALYKMPTTYLLCVGSKRKSEDTFGMNDDDWDLYKQIVSADLLESC